MGKAITVHSHKGGTGKTLVAANLAAIYAKNGHNVCLLDFDLRAPSQHILFKTTPKYWLNDFLEGICDIRSAITDLSEKYGSKGKFFVGFANPSSKAIREMMIKDRRWEMEALKRMIKAKDMLYDDLKVDYLIFDTSPGIYYSSINAIACSDVVLLVMKMDEFDIEGTQELISGIYDALGRKKTGIIVNRIISRQLGRLTEDEVKPVEELESMFARPIIAMIPCFCDIQLTGGKAIYAVKNPEHSFIETLEAVGEKLEQL